MVSERLEDTVSTNIANFGVLDHHSPGRYRFSLNYKGLSHKTEWVEFPDIEPLCKKLGLPPTRVPPTGPPNYTLPAIYDPNTKKYVVESAAIARYLDETYPETPLLFPPGTAALQTAFIDIAWPSIGLPLYFSIMGTTTKKLNPSSAEFFRRTREQAFGQTMEALASDENWQAWVAGLGKVKSALESGNPTGKRFLMGDRITFADFQIASALIWIKVADDKAWEKVSSLHNGLWKTFLDSLVQYSGVY